MIDLLATMIYLLATITDFLATITDLLATMVDLLVTILDLPRSRSYLNMTSRTRSTVSLASSVSSSGSEAVRSDGGEN